MEKKQRKPRRTKFSLEKDFMDAVKSVIENEGFSKTTLAAISEKANIMPNVFYNRYNSLEELFNEYVKRYDYWLADITNTIDTNKIDDYADLFQKILKGLIESLYPNRSMQQLLIWELAEENEITVRSARLREANAAELVNRFDEAYKLINKKIDIRVVSALFISGIYYLILHKNRSTFCNIDFSKKEGKQLLLDNIEELAKLIFGNNQKNEVLRVAYNMKIKGIDLETIMDVTGLTGAEVQSLL
ncbi:MAG: TetR/AcrR family transcriptional regulator [Tissierellia bacterium]|nr:TetR/AcrR family transcriptional regulator [Tissierellia bacterium]